MEIKEIVFKDYVYDIEFVCDECSLPLVDYGNNVILAFENDKIVTRMLCDIHTQEIIGEEFES